MLRKQSRIEFASCRKSYSLAFGWRSGLPLRSSGSDISLFHRISPDVFSKAQILLDIPYSPVIVTRPKTRGTDGTVRGFGRGGQVLTPILRLAKSARHATRQVSHK